MSEEKGIQCGRCLRTLRRNDSYCPFCAGERMRIDTPEAMKLQQIAKVCHAAVQAFSETMGEYIPSWSQLDATGKMDRIQGVKWRTENLHLSPRKVHEAWRKEMMDNGWKYGPKTNSAKKLHSGLVEYDELSPEQQLKDRLYGAIVESLTQPQEISVSSEDIINLLEKLRGPRIEGDQ